MTLTEKVILTTGGGVTVRAGIFLQLLDALQNAGKLFIKGGAEMDLLSTRL